MATYCNPSWSTYALRSPLSGIAFSIKLAILYVLTKSDMIFVQSLKIPRIPYSNNATSHQEPFSSSFSRSPSRTSTRAWPNCAPPAPSTARPRPPRRKTKKKRGGASTSRSRPSRARALTARGELSTISDLGCVKPRPRRTCEFTRHRAPKWRTLPRSM